MVGAPDSGKTNYLGRLWGALECGKNAGLRAAQEPRRRPLCSRGVQLAFLKRPVCAANCDTNVDLEGSDCSIQVAWERRGGGSSMLNF